LKKGPIGVKLDGTAAFLDGLTEGPKYFVLRFRQRKKKQIANTLWIIAPMSTCFGIVCLRPVCQSVIKSHSALSVLQLSTANMLHELLPLAG